jgi:hypothetical protein
MAKNLRQKLPKDDVLYVQDINTAAPQKLIEEMAGLPVVALGSAREVAEKAVRCFRLYSHSK